MPEIVDSPLSLTESRRQAGKTELITTAPPSRRMPRRERASRTRQTWRRALARDWRLYTFLIAPILFLLIFRYLPMLGNVIASGKSETLGTVLGAIGGAAVGTAIDRSGNKNDVRCR